MSWLTLIGIASIQDYVFRSNRLKENTGASLLIEEALSYWNRRLPRENIIYIGGGNAALQFDTKQEAVSAVARWSREQLDRVPGLKLVATHEEIANGENEAYRVAVLRLRKLESGLPTGCGLGALPVVRTCPSTGFAVTQEEKGVWLSDEAVQKRRKVRDALERQNSEFLRPWSERFTMPEQLSQLGTLEGASQIAVVHADGDGIGELMKNAEGFRELREISNAIISVTSGALANTIRWLVGAIDNLEDKHVLSLKRDSEGRRFLPMRPIIVAGDDLTFVCNGKLGLHLAVHYLQEFERLSSEVLADRGPYTACAGVLIMPEKFPFARGYDMAEELCANAKAFRRQVKEERGNAFCCLDFHLVLEGATEKIGLTRQQDHEGLIPGAEKLNRKSRPYAVSGGDDSWIEFETTWKELNDTGNISRNRAKRLFHALTRDNAEFKQLLNAFGLEQSRLPDRIGFLDALEFLDFHVDPALFQEKQEAHA